MTGREHLARELTQFDSRPGVCGDGRTVVGYRHAMFVRDFSTFGRWNDQRCVPGPIRVSLTVSGDEVTQVQTQVGGAWPATSAPVTDLSEVAPREAAAYFFSLGPRLESASTKDRLLLPAVLADDAIVLPPLLALARDAARTEQTRRRAVQWLGLLGDSSVVSALVGLASEVSDVRIGHSYQGNWSTDTRTAPCNAGPVQVRLTLRDGDVERVETWAGTLRSREGRDIGEVPAAESAQYLISIATRGSSGASARAILPAVLADSATVWPALLVIARDSQSRSHATRQDAAFWLSRFAASAIAGKAHDLLDDDDADGNSGDGGKEDLKRHAVFVLSQLPHREGVPALLDIARSNADRKVRGQALFWLGQSGDPRALALFESLLRT